MFMKKCCLCRIVAGTNESFRGRHSARGHKVENLCSRASAGLFSTTLSTRRQFGIAYRVSNFLWGKSQPSSVPEATCHTWARFFVGVCSPAVLACVHRANTAYIIISCLCGSFSWTHKKSHDQSVPGWSIIPVRHAYRHPLLYLGYQAIDPLTLLQRVPLLLLSREILSPCRSADFRASFCVEDVPLFASLQVKW